MSRILSRLSAVVAVFLISASVYAGDLWKDAFSSGSESVRQDGYEQLKATTDDVARLEGIDTLRDLYRKELSKYQKTINGLKKSIPGFHKGDDALGSLFREWVAARDEAYTLYMDAQLFPFPSRPVTGPEKGYYDVMPKVNETIGIYDSRIKKAMAGAAKKLFHKRTLKTLAQIDTLEVLLAERSAVLVELDDAHTAFTADPNTLIKAAALLGEEKYSESVALFGKLTENEQAAYFFLHGHAIMNWAERNPNGHSGAMMKALRLLNELRISLGSTPVHPNQQLFDAMNKHDAWCGQISHTGEGGSSAQQRCMEAGYRGGVSENMSSAGCVAGVGRWRNDGGHFRNMVSPHWQEIGFSPRGFNVGHGVSTAIPSITPPWLVGKMPTGAALRGN
jgi:uncharacterized protein YkwD